MAKSEKPSWIRAEDGDWYRTSEVVAVKTQPHHDGGFTVAVETHRHDNIEIAGRLEDVEHAAASRDDLVRLLATVGSGRLVRFADGAFLSEKAADRDD
jgi:hypothetical protein